MFYLCIFWTKIPTFGRDFLLCKKLVTLQPKKLKEVVDKLKDMIVTLEFDPKTKVTIIKIKGIWKDNKMIETRLSDADKEWIADLIARTVKPINERLTNIENRLENLENRIKAIENCPTIKNELSKNKK